MNQKKTTALLLGLTMSLTGTAFAAPTDQAQDIDSRIAALEQQQSNLEKEIKELRHQNSQLKNQTRSQKKQLSGLSKSVKSELDRVQISGFGRVSWDNDNIKGYIDRNDNRRFYLDLKGKFKVNDDWNFNFESETNPRYANYVMADGTLKSHNGHDDEDGVIQRVWAEGKTGVVNYDIGRRWRGLGFQNILLGNETDGAVISTAIPKSKLTANAFYLTPTDKGYDFSVYGAGAQGQVGHGLQISAAIAKLNIGKHESMGQNVYDTKPSEYRNTAGSLGFVLSAMWNPMKNIFLIGDYARTNGQDYTVGEWGANGYTETKYDKHDCTALRLNYRWSNINDPGSFQLYARWYNSRATSTTSSASSVTRSGALCSRARRAGSSASSTCRPRTSSGRRSMRWQRHRTRCTATRTRRTTATSSARWSTITSDKRYPSDMLCCHHIY